MHPILSAVLETICQERDNLEYRRAFYKVAALVQEYGEQGLTECLFDEIPRTVPFEIVSELLGLLMWQTSDNGAAISRTMERWLLEGVDNRKLRIALSLEVYPFQEQQEMERVLLGLAKSNPGLLIVVINSSGHAGRLRRWASHLFQQAASGIA